MTGDEMDIDSVVAALAALGHKVRLQVWGILVPYGPLGLPAGAIAARLEVAPSSLSFHLQQMTQSRILVHRRSSRQIIYAVNNEVMNSLCDFLGGGETICFSPIVLPGGQSGDIIGER